MYKKFCPTKGGYSYLAMCLLLSLAACQTDYSGKPLKVDLYRTFYGCQLNEAQDSVIFEHPRYQCSADSRYFKTQIPLKYVSNCRIANKKGGSGRGVVSMKVSYPDFRPIPISQSNQVKLSEGTVLIEIITRPCDIYKVPTSVFRAENAEYRIKKGTYSETRLSDNLYVYEKKQRPKYRDGVYKQYLIKDKSGKISHSVGCDQKKRCHAYDESPDGAYFYSYSFIGGDKTDFKEMHSQIMAFTSNLFSAHLIR